MATLLLAVIYIMFIGIGVPDSLFGVAWPAIYPEFGVGVSSANLVTMTVAGCTIISSLLSARLISRFGTSIVTAVSTAMTAFALFGFSISSNMLFLVLFAIPLGLGAGAIDSALNSFVALHYERAVEGSLDGVSIIGHLPDVCHDLRDRDVLILGDFFAQLQLDIIADVQNNKGKCICICQSVLFRKYPDQMIAHFNPAVQLHPEGIILVVCQRNPAGCDRTADGHQLFVDIVDTAGEFQNERIFSVVDNRIDHRFHSFLPDSALRSGASLIASRPSLKTAMELQMIANILGGISSVSARSQSDM